MEKQYLYNAIKSGDLVSVKNFFESSTNKEISDAIFGNVQGGNGILQYILKQHQHDKRPVNVEIFGEVLRHCSDDVINTKDANGEYPLLLAARTGGQFLCQFQNIHLTRKTKLLKRVNWKVTDNQGRGVLVNAILSDDPECCDLVLKLPDALYHVRARENDNSNVLHCLFNNYTAKPEQKAVFNVVLNKIKSLYAGIDNAESSTGFGLNNLLDEKNKLGETPLHLLARSELIGNLGNEIDFDYILKNCNLLARTKNNESVIDLAVKHNNTIIVPYILKSAEQSFEELCYRESLAQQQKLQQQEKQSAQLVIQQEKLLDSEHREEIRRDILYSNLRAACSGEELKIKKLLQDIVKSDESVTKIFDISKIKSKLALEVVLEKRAQLQQEIERLEAGIFDDRDSKKAQEGKALKVRCELDDITIIRSYIDKLAELQRKVKHVRQEINETIKKARLPLSGIVDILGLQVKYQELLKIENAQREVEELLFKKVESQKLMKKELDSQVGKELKVIQQDLQKSRQECLKFIEKVLADLQQEYRQREMYVEGLDELEKEQKRVMKREGELKQNRRDLQVESVLTNQLLLRDEILNAIHDSQQASQEEGVVLLNSRLECINSLVDITKSILDIEDRIAEIEKLQVELGQVKKQEIVSESAGTLVDQDSRLLIAKHIVLLDMEMQLQRDIVKQIQKGERVIEKSKGQAIFSGIQVPLLTMSDQELALEKRIQGVQHRLLTLRNSSLRILDKQLSEDKQLSDKSVKQLGRQVEEQLKNLSKLKEYGNQTQEAINGIQKSQETGEVVPELHILQEEKKHIEKEYNRRLKVVATLQKEIAGKKKEGIQEILQEFKCALFENLNESNFLMLSNYKRVLGDYSAYDSELVSSIVKGYKRFSNIKECHQYYKRVNDLGIDIGIIKHLIESRDITSIKRTFRGHERSFNQNAFIKEVIKVKDDNFLNDVVAALGVSRVLDCMINCSEKEGPLNYISPEAFINITHSPYITNSDYQKLAQIFARNGDLFDKVIEETSSRYLIADDIANIIYASRKDPGCTAVMMPKVKRFLFCCVNHDQMKDLESLLKHFPYMIYDTEHGKSLLETASDLENVPLVKHIISVHRGMILQAVRDHQDDVSHLSENLMKSFDEISAIHHEDVLNILKENAEFIRTLDPSVRSVLVLKVLDNAQKCGNTELLLYCAKVYPELTSKDLDYNYNPARIYDTKSSSATISTTPLSKEKSVLKDMFPLSRGNVGQFGILSPYVSIVRSGDIKRFQTEIVDLLNDNVAKYAEKSHGEIGHTVFTLVAALGNVEQWNKLVKGYQGIAQDRKTKNLFVDIGDPLNGNKLSTLLSPFQAAVIKCNTPMIKYFIENIKPKELAAVYGDNGDNVFHTMISEDQFNLVEDIIHNGRFPADILVKAFLQPNKEGVTPFAIAAQKGYKRVCVGFIHEIAQHKKHAKDLMMNEFFVKGIVDSKECDLLEELFHIENYTGRSISKKRLNLTKHKIEGHNLLTYACKVGDEEFIRSLMKYYNEKDLFGVLQEVVDPKLNIKSDIFYLFLSNLISRSTDPNVLDKVSRSVMHNANALAAFSVLENASDLSINQKFSIGDIIKKNKSEALRYLIEKKGEDFWLECDQELSHLGLAVCYPDLLGVCCDYLKNNPEIAVGNDVLPYGAMLSNNLELLKQLIKRNPALLLAQYDIKAPAYKKIAKQLEGNYKCKLKSSETLCDFARRENVNPNIVDYLERASLRYCNNIMDGANNPVVSESLLRTVAKHANEVMYQYPKLYDYTINQCINCLKSDIFHLVTEDNVKFLHAIAERSYKHAIDVGDKKLQGIIKKMINQINPSNGLSFFQYLAVHGNYDMYNSIKLLCGDINSKTSQKANLAHLCAYSGMKDEEGNFEFKNLIKGNKKLAVASDRRGRGLLYHAAEGRVQSSKLREEAVNLILSEKLDASVEKLPKNKYYEQVFDAIFVSENPAVSNDFLARISIRKRDDFIKQQKNLLHIVKNTSDPSRKEALLSYESKFATRAEALVGNPEEIDDSSRVSPPVSLQSGITQSGSGAEALPSSQHVGLSSSLADGNIESDDDLSEDDVLPESEIVISKNKKEILDSQNEIESLIQAKGSFNDYIGAIDRAPSASALQLRTLSEEASIAERAVLSGNLDFIKALVNSNKKLNPNITDKDGNTLLHKFVEFLKRNPEKLSDREVHSLFVGLLHNHNFDINCRNKSGDTALDMLLELEGSDATFMELLTRHSRANEYHDKRFSQAKSTFFDYNSTYDLSNEIKESKVLQRKFSDLCYKICSSILSDESVKYKSVADENYIKLRKILNDDVIRKTLANTDSDGNNVLQRLCRDVAAGKIKNDNFRLLELIETVVRCLKDKDPGLLQDLLFNNRNLKFENGMETIACVPGTYTLVKTLEELLGKRKISDTCDFNSMLVNCAEAGNADLYSYLRESYASIGINNVDIHSNSSLHKAVMTGSKEMVEAVLSTGSNINRKDKDGNTPLHSLLIFMISYPDMVTLKHIELVEFLVSRGASLNVRNELGILPPQLARFIDNSGKLSERFLGEQVDVLQSLINGRDKYYGIKSQCISNFKNCVQLEQGMKYDDIRFDIIGGILSTSMGGGKLQTTKLLSSGFCQEHSLRTVKFNFSDEDKGYVQSVGKKRNYVVTNGSVKLKLSWKPVVPKGAKEQVVNVIVNSDGSVLLDDQDIEKYGSHGEKIHFDRCCIYLGGIKLEDALRNGRWKEQRSKDSPISQKVKSTASLDRDHEVDESVGLDPPLEASALDKGRNADKLVDRDPQISMASHQSLGASKFTVEENKTLLSPKDHWDMSLSTDTDETMIESLVSKLPDTLYLPEQKSRFLHDRLDLTKYMRAFEVCVNSSDRTGFQGKLKSLCSSYGTVFLRYREALGRLSSEMLKQESVSETCKQILKKYRNDLQSMYILQRRLQALSYLDGPSRELVRQVCQDESIKYNNMYKKIYQFVGSSSKFPLTSSESIDSTSKSVYGQSPQLKTVESKDVSAKIKVGISDDGLHNDIITSKVSSLTQGSENMEPEAQGSNSAQSPKKIEAAADDIQKGKKKEQTILMQGLVPRIINDDKKNDSKKIPTIERSSFSKDVLKFSQSGLNVEQHSGNAVKDLSKRISRSDTDLINPEKGKRSSPICGDEDVIRLSKSGWNFSRCSDDVVKSIQKRWKDNLIQYSSDNDLYRSSSKGMRSEDVKHKSQDHQGNSNPDLQDVPLTIGKSKSVDIEQEFVSDASLGSVTPLPSPKPKNKSKGQSR
ncbi:ankyrin repeat domain-containing protein [Ehrlichia muris]|uniref:ankyrin repeat domain-containing protein n=1 Tax=Ehrlichia muris TaxID=35795 RepID=UPI0037BF5F5A